MITKLLVGHVHYLVANVVAIVIASVANFVVNDNWTFGRLRLLLRRARHHAHAHDKPADPPPR
ncbi:MAG: GtrA family protein [Betaproteobacteria bacterium]|nr:GtrA family protein [Betaproteobacteria bacterium]